MRFLLVSLFICCQTFSTAQIISGTVTNKKTNQPVAYVNIGIAQKNIGTVSDVDGNFKLEISAEFDGESLVFSSIGYKPLSIKIRQLRNGGMASIVMEEKVQELKEVVIMPRIFKQKMLGIETTSKFMNAGFHDNQLGYEMGMLMEVKKSAVLKNVYLNIANCSYDTVFYRLNIYKEMHDMSYELVLDTPIYINLPRDKVLDKIIIDLQPYDLVMEGNFLVTVELVKNLGPGDLHFCASLRDKTYIRKTSQGTWETLPVGISISVLADVEK